MTQILIKQADQKKLLYYTQVAYNLYESEIGGMLLAQETSDKNILLTKPVILKQVVGSGTTELDNKALSKYYFNTYKAHGANLYHVWWHSHGKGQPFFSSTDESTIKTFSRGRDAISLCVNYSGEMLARVSVFYPLTAHKDIKPEILGNTQIPEGYIKKVEALCTKKTYSTSWSMYDDNEIGQTSIYPMAVGPRATYDIFQHPGIDKEQLKKKLKKPAVRQIIKAANALLTKYYLGNLFISQFTKALVSINNGKIAQKYNVYFRIPTYSQLHHGHKDTTSGAKFLLRIGRYSAPRIR